MQRRKQAELKDANEHKLITPATDQGTKICARMNEIA